MREETPFPWEDAMRFAFGYLRLSPQAFWSMTMRELNCAMMAHFGGSQTLMSRGELENLINKHPDGNPANGN